MREAREEMIQSIHEANVIDKVKDIVKRKQATKIDGVLVDLFTASAISQIYDKVNPMNKKKMERLPIKKLASAAMRVMDKNEYVPEEVELDEAKGSTKYVVIQGPGDNNQKVIATFDGGPKALEKAKKFRDDWNKKNKSKIKLNKKGKPIAAHMARIFDKGVETSYKVGDKVSYSAFAPSIIKDEVGLDEGKMKDLSMKIDDVVAKMKKDRNMKGFADKFKKDAMKSMDIEKSLEKVLPDYIAGKDIQKLMKEYYEMGTDEYRKLGEAAGDVEDLIKMVDELENASKMHLGQSKRIKAHLQGMKDDEYAGQEIKTEGAAADARRAMRSDPDMKQRFSKDMSATDADRAAASKNIIMQMRKSQSLRGRFDVEFQDGKKVKVPLNVALAVQQKYNSLRRPAEKEKFQSVVGKSYKDMLKALKEGFASDAQRRAAFAQGYKAKGKKGKKEDIDEAGYVGRKDPMPAGKELAKLMKKRRKGKKESKLERMNNKLQENKNG